ncbi:hypothetical protein [Cryobacterium sp. MDB2-33-2]|uniref:hypothetical protein n=1 Tax=Cryobacterium sp. MDB2-33-2 TaxID=1259179 RepID=UPI00106B681F|nr:hypothetical protein [Cryobacterium sp. MDB2-33-2]TFC02745.1 hypothetical protein E3O59_17490 [Cryobacterium sp. MDB2-33-2]
MNYASSCGIELQVNQDGSVSVAADTSVGTYDGADDTLVGIVNNSTVPVAAVTVTGPGSGLAGFDSDGLCAYAGCSYGPTGYEGPGTSLVTSPTLPDSAEADFTPALQPGATAYFSLEGPLQYAQLTARKGPLKGNAAQHTLIYVHGINEESTGKKTTDFKSIFDRVTNTKYVGFVYYEDLAPADPARGIPDCREGLPTDVLTKAANAQGMPISISDATGNPNCDGSSDIGINAIKLDEQIQQEYHDGGNQPVILVGYSMGGSIIRGMLAYSQTVNDRVADTMIDSVSFIHGVQQGSYLANIGQVTACSFCGFFPVPPLSSGIVGISDLIHLPLNRPASQELQDGSAWFRWVNSHSSHLPPLPFFNTYGDLRIVVPICPVFGLYGCFNYGDNTSLGDDVVLRGTDEPTDTSAEGGQKFLNGPRGAQNWEFVQLHRYTWDPVFPPSEAIALGQAMFNAPEQHLNVRFAMGQTLVKDCQTNASISADDELVLLLNGRANGTPYNCKP